MKQFISFLATLLIATSAMAVDTTAFVRGETDPMLFSTGITEVVLDGECVIMHGDGDAASATCGTDITTERFVGQDTIITGFAVTLYLAGDAASYECDFQLRAAGAVAGTKLEQATSTVVGTTARSADMFVLVEEGESFEVIVTDGGSGCAGTIDPKYTVDIYGWVVGD